MRLGSLVTKPRPIEASYLRPRVGAMVTGRATAAQAWHSSAGDASCTSFGGSSMSK